MRTCKHCGTIEYIGLKNTFNTCNKCDSLIRKNRYETNKNEILEKRKDYYCINKNHIIEQHKHYREENRETVKSTNRKHHSKHRSKRIEYLKKYRQENKQTLQHKKQIYVKNRKITHPEFNLKLVLRQRVRSLLKNKNIEKSSTFNHLLGCSALEAKKYIESKFLPNMTWDNYGIDWHIDHFCPCAEFDFSNKRHQEVCFHYTNLVPTWKYDNLSKGDSIIIPCPS